MTLILSRSGQGIGGAVMFATSLALSVSSFQGKDRGVAFGVWGAITGVAVSLGPILGGVITTYHQLASHLPGERAHRCGGRRHHLVASGRVAFPAPRTAGLDRVWPLDGGADQCCLWPDQGGRTSWGDAGVADLPGTRGILLPVSPIAEARVTDPLFDLALFRVPTFDGGLIAAFCMNGSLFAMLLYLVLYLQYAVGYSALQTGLRLLLISGPILVTATVAGRLSEHVPVRWLFRPGLVLVGAGLFLMTGLSRHQLVDAFGRRLHNLGGGRRLREPAPGINGDRRGRTSPRRDGFRCERDVPPDRYRRKHRCAGHDLQLAR